MTSEDRDPYKVRTRSDRRVEEHIRRVGAAEYYHKDSLFHSSITLLKTLLAQVTMAMEDEGVEPKTIERVLSKVIYGTVSPGEIVRMEQEQIRIQATTERLSTSFPPGVIPPDSPDLFPSRSTPTDG